MEFYTIEFTVAAEGVTPDTPQSAGHTGDHKAAVVRFRVPFKGYRYRIEIIDGGGGYDTTELLDAQGGVVSYAVPSAWTTAGVATLRLVAIEQSDDDAEVVRFHSAPAYLLFADREAGEALGETLRPAWQETLDEAQFFLNTVEQKLENGELKGDKGDKGDTPQKGVDYYTNAEKEALVAELGARDVDQNLDMESKKAVANWVVATELKEWILTIEAFLGEVNHAHDRIDIVDGWIEELRNTVGDLAVGDQLFGDEVIALKATADNARDRIDSLDGQVESIQSAVSDLGAVDQELDAKIGDIETVLDGILAIQGGFIGGACV